MWSVGSWFTPKLNTSLEASMVYSPSKCLIGLSSNLFRCSLLAWSPFGPSPNFNFLWLPHCVRHQHRAFLSPCPDASDLWRCDRWSQGPDTTDSQQPEVPNSWIGRHFPIPSFCPFCSDTSACCSRDWLQSKELDASELPIWFTINFGLLLF